MIRSIIYLLILFSIPLSSMGQLIGTSTTTGGTITTGNNRLSYAAGNYQFNTLNLGETSHTAGLLASFFNSAEDSLLLVEFYQATDGDNWTNNDGWLTAPLNEWFGIGLNGEGRVFEVNLGDNNLVGTLPSSLGGLTEMRFFYVWNNPNLSGELFSILLNWPILERVSAHDCSLSGNLPAELFALPNLLELRLFNNNFGGTIPPEIGNAPVLDQLELGNCGLSGEIPEGIGNLKDLFIIDLSSNALSGTLPDSIYTLSNLQYLRLANNQLSGGLSPLMGQLTHLIELDFNDNNLLGGTIPPEIAQMDSLTYLRLANTNLSGEVPAAILNCPSLQELWIDRNNLTGTLPDVLNMPDFRALHAGGNVNLLVDLPDNIGELTQLEFLAIWNTRPNGGEFPEGIYNLTNLYGLDLSEQQFTGTLSSEIGNLVNLTSLYLRNNRLEGPVPTEMLNLTNLDVLDLNTNFFTDLPAGLESLPNLRQIRVNTNRLNFSDLLPFAALDTGGNVFYQYTPQRPRGALERIEMAQSATVELDADIDGDGTTYQWNFNGQDIEGANSAVLSVSFDELTDLGAYVCRAENAAIDSFALFSRTIRLVEDKPQPKSYYVSHDPNHFPDFATAAAAFNATAPGDTLYFHGSDSSYLGLSLYEPRVVMGPGYFLEENDLRVNQKSAKFNNISFTYSETSNWNPAGSQVFGVESRQIFFQNNITATDTLRNVLVSNSKADYMAFLANAVDVNVEKSYIDSLAFLGSIPANNWHYYYGGSSLDNSIVRKIYPWNASSVFSDEMNGIASFSMDRNTVRIIDAGITGFTFSNTLYEQHIGNANFTASQQAEFATVLTNGSDSLKQDSDFIPADAGLNVGAYSGTSPYQLSGIPPIPTIISATQGDMLKVNVNASNNDGQGVNINQMEVSLLNGAQLINSYIYSSFSPDDLVNFEFSPRIAGLQPNQSYSLMLRMKDANGRQSHKEVVNFETLTAAISGQVSDLSSNPITDGTVRAFRFNPNRARYDTLGSVSIGAGGSYTIDNLLQGEYLILARPNNNTHPRTLPTYHESTIDWQNATLVPLVQNQSGINVVVEELPAPPDEPEEGSLVLGYVEELEEGENGRLLLNRRVRGAAVSIRTSTTITRFLRDSDDGYDLVAYVETNENGEFSFEGLEAGTYRLRIDIPGVPVDEESDFEFELRGVRGEESEFAATVTEEGIVVERIRYVNVDPELAPKLIIYPNPSRDVFNIKSLNGLNENVQLDVVDIQGRIIRTQSVNLGNVFQVDLSNQVNGMYLIRITHEDGKQAIHRVILKK